LRTPYVQQWSLGFQYELTKNLLVEARYAGTRGMKLLQAVSFAQGYDLNDASAPDFPNIGFTAQGDAFDTNANRAVSDFDRPHRFSMSFVYDLSSLGSRSKLLTGWQISGFGQAQSAVPYSIFSCGGHGGHSVAVQQPPARLRRPLSSGLRAAQPVRHACTAPAGGRRPDRTGFQPFCALLAAQSGRGLPEQSWLRQPR
jgi:hypothetical protein